MDKKMFYQKLMENKPMKVHDPIENSRGQKIEFYENPFNPDFPIVAACHELKLAGSTEFFCTSEFYKDSEYNPVFVNDDLMCEYEL